MTTVTIRYFIVTGPRADAIRAEGLAKIKENRAQRRAMLDEFGAINFYEYKGRDPMGIVIKAEAAEDRAGFLKPEKHVEDGETYWAYKFDLRTKAGKTSKAKCQGMGVFDFSDFIVRALGVNHATIGPCKESRSGSAMFFSVAGLIDDTIVVKIPCGGEDPDVSIPDDFTELRESQFVAISKEGAKIADVLGVEA